MTLNALPSIRSYRDGAVVRLSGPGGIAVPRVTLAKGFWRRFRGRLWTNEFPQGEGLLLIPCHDIHMMGMKYPLDVVFLDKDLTILTTRGQLPIGTMQCACPGAAMTLELPAGTLDPRWSDGLQLRLEPLEGVHPP